jgi:hypothetical protein
MNAKRIKNMKITTIKIQYICEVKIHLYNGNVISTLQTKKLLNDPDLSDEQAEEIRDGFRLLAEVIFDKWFEERKKGQYKQSKEVIIN